MTTRKPKPQEELKRYLRHGDTKIGEAMQENAKLAVTRALFYSDFNQNSAFQQDDLSELAGDIVEIVLRNFGLWRLGDA